MHMRMRMPARGASLRLVAIAALACVQANLARGHEPDETPQPTPSLSAPVLVERVEALYPEAALKAGIGGTVGLELTVAADGSVHAVKVLRPAGFGLDEAAATAARQFRFRPAARDGHPIAATVLFDQEFVVRPHLTAETIGEPARLLQVTSSPEVLRYESTVQSLGPKSAASASSIRNLDFDLRPKGSPNDILRVVPGLLTAQHQGGGKADQLFLRGFDADHGTDVGVFVDGVPVNMPSHAHGQGYADLHFIIPEAVERIDVEKGPYDVRYGDFATGGAVNLVTRKQFDESSVGITVGGFPTLSCRDFLGCKAIAQERFVGIVAPRLSGWAEKLHPWVAFELARDEGPFVTPEQLYRYNLFAKVSYDFSPRTSAGVLIEAYGSGWVGSGQIPEREVTGGRLDRFGSLDPSEGGITERQMVTAFLHHRDAKHELDATVYFTRYRLQLWNDFSFFLRDPVNGDEIEQDDARTFTGANLSYHLHGKLGRVSFRTTVGAQLRYDGVHVDLWDATSQDGDFRKRLGRHLDTSGYGFGNNDDIDQLNLAAYLEEDVVFTRWFRAVVGLRADYFDFIVDDKGETLGAAAPATSGAKQKSLLSPKATLVFTPVQPLDLYLNFGMGFHSNDARIVVKEGQTTPAGSVVNVVPRIYGGELGARYAFRSYFSVAAAFWASYLENETVFSGDSGVFAPSDPTARYGLDLEVRAQPLSWLYLDFDLAQATSTAVPELNGGHGNGGAVALAPKLYMTGGITAKHRIGLRGGLRFRYLGDRPAFDERSPEYLALDPTDPRRVNAQGYFIVDLYGAYRYRWLEAGLSIQNLFNSAWREAQLGSSSCTRDETYNPLSPHADVCNVNLPADKRVGVADVHFTPGVPLNLQVSLKAYF
jgi:TonB family protein